MKPNSRDRPIILMADDDEDDCFLAQKAFEEARILNEIRFVSDGEELLRYLKREGKYSDPKDSPRPGLIFLDLNMPKVDGRQALSQIKSDPDLKTIPILALTTSSADEDILRTYQLGVNSYIQKPVSFDGLVLAMKAVNDFWLEIVRLPNEG